MHELRMLTRAGARRRLTRAGLAAVAALLVLLGMSACGGGHGDPPGEVVARIGVTTVTRPELSHWMSTLAGGDFYEIGRGHAVPARLASEPPDYAACVASLQAAAANARRGQAGATPPALNTAQLLDKCHELYSALRLQATAYVVEGHWLTAVAAAVGVRASEAEVHSMLREIEAREYPGPGQFQRYLANSRRSLADELYVIRLDVLERRLGQQLSTHAKQVELLEAGHQVTAQTDCRAGYVVPHCRQFKTSKTPGRSPVVLLEQVATITGIPCVNRQACG
jgi:hypothetical protein